MTRPYGNHVDVLLFFFPVFELSQSLLTFSIMFIITSSESRCVMKATTPDHDSPRRYIISPSGCLEQLNEKQNTT